MAEATGDRLCASAVMCTVAEATALRLVYRGPVPLRITGRMRGGFPGFCEHPLSSLAALSQKEIQSPKAKGPKPN